MKTVRFTRDTDPQREGGSGFKAGDVVELRDASAERWISRGAAKYHDPKAKAEKPAEAEVQDGNTVDGSADVGGEDGGDPGQRTEPAAQPARGRGRGPGRGW